MSVPCSSGSTPNLLHRCWYLLAGWFFPTFVFFFRSVFGFFFRTPFYSVPANSTTSLQNKVSVTRTSKSEDPWFSSDSSFTTSMAPHGYEFNLSIWRNWGWLVDGEEGWMEGEVGQNVLANRCGIPVDKWVDSRSFGKTFWLKCALVLEVARFVL